MLQANFQDPDEIATEQYRGITPLRLLLNQKSDPKLIDRIKYLMDHNEERKNDELLWESHKTFFNSFRRYVRE